jgi:hypothetical protein
MAYALRRTRKHVLNLLRRQRALTTLLAGCDVEGCTEAVMLAHGFTPISLSSCAKSRAIMTP